MVVDFLAGMDTIEWRYLKISGMVLEKGYPDSIAFSGGEAQTHIDSRPR